MKKLINKKWIGLILCLSLLLALLAGCDTDRIGGSLSSLDEDDTPTKSTASQKETEDEEEEGTPNAGVSEEDPTEEAENKSYLGRMEGGIYENAYAGYGCKLDTSWTFYTAEELQELPEDVAELFEGSDVGDSISKYTQITDMMAENTKALTSINVLYQKLDATARLAFVGLDEEAVIDEVMKQSESMKTAYAQAGIEVISFEKVTVTFLGEEHTALLMSSTMQGVPYYTLQMMDYSLGQYSVTLTLASFQENTTEALLDLFYTVN